MKFFGINEYTDGLNPQLVKDKQWHYNTHTKLYFKYVMVEGLRKNIQIAYTYNPLNFDEICIYNTNYSSKEPVNRFYLENHKTKQKWGVCDLK